MPRSPSRRRDDILQRAERVIPNGASSAGRAVFRDVVVQASGAHVWNVDGDRFIDHLLAFGPIVLGHCDERINSAVAKATATCDLTWVGPQLGEVELAERICELMPGAEKVAFCTSGSDATLHATHVARAATGRTRILKFHGSYHGWHDHLAVGVRARPGQEHDESRPHAAGLLASTLAEVTVVDWNDIDAVERVFATEGNELAAVFAEPYVHSYGCVAPAPGFLERLRDLCDAWNVVLVFDEIKTGFRHALGGYQSICGVTPDLTTFGKAIANGYSVAGLAGSAAVMDLLGTASASTVTLNGTYNASPYAIAAGLATLERLQDNGIDRIAELGDRLRDGLAELCEDSGIDACVAGYRSEWVVYFRKEPPTNYREALESDLELAECFRTEMLHRGVLMPPFPMADCRTCAAMTDDDINRTLEAAAGAMDTVVQRAERSRNPA